MFHRQAGRAGKCGSAYYVMPIAAVTCKRVARQRLPATRAWIFERFRACIARHDQRRGASRRCAATTFCPPRRCGKRFALNSRVIRLKVSSNRRAVN